MSKTGRCTKYCNRCRSLVLTPGLGMASWEVVFPLLFWKQPGLKVKNRAKNNALVFHSLTCRIKFLSSCPQSLALGVTLCTQARELTLSCPLYLLSSGLQFLKLSLPLSSSTFEFPISTERAQIRTTAPESKVSLMINTRGNRHQQLCQDAWGWPYFQSSYMSCMNTVLPILFYKW